MGANVGACHHGGPGHTDQMELQGFSLKIQAYVPIEKLSGLRDLKHGPPLSMLPDKAEVVLCVFRVSDGFV